MNNKIIKLDDITIESITKAMIFHSGEAFATTTQIAKYFGMRHDNLVAKIRAFYSFNDLIKSLKIKELKRTYRGNEYLYYELNADAFAFICLSITGKKAEAFKWVFIEAFKQAALEAITAKVSIEANKANEKWIEARDHGKDTRKLLTDKIKEFCLYSEQQRGSPYKPCPYYKHITNAIYTYIGVPIPKAGKSPRDVYSGDIVEAIEAAELEVIDLLTEVMEAGENRKGIKQHITKRLKQNAVGNIV